MFPITSVTDDLGRDYPEILAHVVKTGRESSPRGLLIKEATPFVLQVDRPTRCIVDRPGFSEALMYLEIASVISGTFDQDLYNKVSPQAAAMLSPQGAYGPRVAGQIPYVISELVRDPDSRRAVVYVGRETDLRYSEHFEQACTMTWQFLIRDGELNMIVNMRAWDLVWGLGYDVPVFVAVGDCVASALGVKFGTFMCIAGSGHVYERHFSLEAKPNYGRDLPSFTAGTDGLPNDEWTATTLKAHVALQAWRTEAHNKYVDPVPLAWRQAVALWRKKTA